jgi:hypothetical protein
MAKVTFIGADHYSTNGIVLIPGRNYEIKNRFHVGFLNMLELVGLPGSFDAKAFREIMV